jgi:hypothetical protein
MQAHSVKLRTGKIVTIFLCVPATLILHHWTPELFHAQEVLEIGYPDRVFFVVFLSPSRQMLWQYLK